MSSCHLSQQFCLASPVRRKNCSSCIICLPIYWFSNCLFLIIFCFMIKLYSLHCIYQYCVPGACSYHEIKFLIPSSTSVHVFQITSYYSIFPTQLGQKVRQGKGSWSRLGSSVVDSTHWRSPRAAGNGQQAPVEQCGWAEQKRTLCKASEKVGGMRPGCR